MRDIKSPAPFTSYYSSLVEISKMEIEKKRVFPCRLVLFLLGFVSVISALGHCRCKERGSSFCTVVQIAGRRARRLVFFICLNQLYLFFLTSWGFGESIMNRGVIWLLGTLLLSGFFIFALKGICSNTLIFPRLTGYFCPKPRMKLITVPQNPAYEGVEKKKN